ncbi:putative adipose-regulatory protein-domain-containing protein [Ephemerocybe angulata]|uniref:Putative adipose-regulatory protein-domain-containing protein n=1 Tax=Ephemerocybe angulata TaxID=980116 RepID=A0A8H6MHI4_9AGAR|nr:putative adipose-regulatory protein-domain-containing protein [Tulosesus angulatus]
MSKSEIRAKKKKEGEGARNGLVYSILAASIGFLRPFAPQIVPILVCSFFIPIILGVSGFAGLVVWNSLSAQWQSPLYLQYGDGVPPFAHTVVPSLHANQRYDVSLHLAVPVSEANLALGNFMATLVLSTTSNKTLVTVRRPAVVVKSQAWWPRRIFGSSGIVTVDIPLLSSFVAGTSSLHADVELGRRDSWKSLGDGVSKELSVHSASLSGLAVPHGIRGLAIRFPLLSSLAAAFIFLLISSMALGACVLPLMLPSGEDDVSDELPLKTSSTSETPRRRRSRFRRTSDTSSSSLAVKVEENVSTIPPPGDKSRERLRQRRTSRNRESDSDGA